MNIYYISDPSSYIAENENHALNQIGVRAQLHGLEEAAVLVSLSSLLVLLLPWLTLARGRSAGKGHWATNNSLEPIGSGANTEPIGSQ